MSKLFRGWLSVGAPLSAAVLLLSGAAFADPAGDKALAGMEEATNRAKTQYFEYEVVNQEPGKGEKHLTMLVRMKGEKRTSEFTAPADMKGTKVLILSPTQMYVYLPAFGKVRRIASNMTDQSFMGMTFTQDDFASQRYSGLYDAKVLSDSGAETKLELSAKQGKTTPYAKIELTIAKDKQVPTELKYYNASGTLVKTETRSNYTCEGNVCTPTELKMVDHSKGGQWTKLVRKQWKVNSEMSDDLFSKRALEK
jgi:hypothetical protein